MPSATSIQIGFKVPPEVAEKLDALGKGMGRPNPLSRSLVAKELVLTALATESSGQAIDLFKHRLTTQPPQTNGEADEQERTEAEDRVEDLIHSQERQNELLKNLLLAIEEVKLIRNRDIPLLRGDVLVSVRALLCQGGASVEAADEWVTNNLAIEPPEA